MKRFTLIIMIAVLSLFVLFSSCEKEEKPDETNNEGSTSATTAVTTAATTAENGGTPTDPSADTHVHAYGVWKTVSEPTCKQSGEKERVCSCGDRETESIAVIDHEYVNNICGMCGQKDPGVFVPDYASGEANVVGSDDADMNYTAQAGYIYYSNGNKIEKMKKDRSAVEAVYKVSAGNVYNVNVAGDWVYFYCEGSTAAKSYIAKVRTDGSGFEKLVSSVIVWEMLVAKDTVYYITITEDWTYNDFAKDAFPLYSVSVNGGMPKQIHDGAVSDITADATYLYFTHTTEDDKMTIRRIKHGTTSASTLLVNAEIRGLSLENSKLYFLVLDKYDPMAATLASITTSGGSYTTYGQIYWYGSFHVVGNKAYFVGSALMSETNPEPEFGLIEYDMNAKTFKLVNDDGFEFGFIGVFDMLIIESYDYDSEKIEYIEIYYAKTGVLKKVDFS